MIKKIILLTLTCLIAFSSSHAQKSKTDSKYQAVEYLKNAESIIKQIGKYKLKQLVIKNDAIYPAKGHSIILADGILHFLEGSGDIANPKVEYGLASVAPGINFVCFNCENKQGVCIPNENSNGVFYCANGCPLCKGELHIDHDFYRRVEIMMPSL